MHTCTHLHIHRRTSPQRHYPWILHFIPMTRQDIFGKPPSDKMTSGTVSLLRMRILTLTYTVVFAFPG